MLSNILVATDASEASLRMLECIESLRRVGSREAVLVHVFDVRTVGGLHETLRRSLLGRLEAQKQRLEQAGFTVSIETPVGIVYHEVNRVAEQRGSSLIVVGSHGESLVAELLLGSTALSILHNARLPVFLIRLEITEENGGKRCQAICADLFGHILFPTDFSDNAARALLYLEHIVQETRTRVTLLHVQDQAKIEPHLKHRLEEFNRIDAERLAGMAARLRECGASSVEQEIRYGSPTRIILERARSNAFSLILMGSQGRGFIHEVFLGSVANNIARLAPLPVIFVPAIR
jgi:nucleotide-binding universal stress UspA family protein